MTTNRLTLNLTKPSMDKTIATASQMSIDKIQRTNQKGAEEKGNQLTFGVEKFTNLGNELFAEKPGRN